MSEFDWLTDPDLVLHEQPAIAVYRNEAGAVVIRRERAWDEDDDTFILVQPHNVRTVADALLRAAGEHAPLALPPPRSRRSTQPEFALDGERP